eukprot:13081302-Alexandrium_andersonii.AAC.1
MVNLGLAIGRGRCRGSAAVSGTSRGWIRASTPVGRGAPSIASLARGTVSTRAERVARAGRSRAGSERPTRAADSRMEKAARAAELAGRPL